MTSSAAPSEPDPTQSQKGKLRGGHDAQEMGRKSAEARRLKKERERQASVEGNVVGSDGGSVGGQQPAGANGVVDPLEALRRVVLDPKAPHAAVVSAAGRLLEAQSAGQAERPASVRELEALSEDELDQLMAQLAPLLPLDPEPA